MSLVCPGQLPDALRQLGVVGDGAVRGAVGAEDVRQD